MEFDKLFDSLPADGWLTRQEATLLLKSVNETKDTILEVGCYYGRSTILLASVGRPVISVDPFSNFNTDDPKGDRIEEGFLHNLERRGIQNVTLFRQRIEDWKGLSIGFGYLDGNHTYQGTINQLAIAVDCGATEICIHDYANQGGGKEIKRAVKTFSKAEVIEVADRLVRCKIT